VSSDVYISIVDVVKVYETASGGVTALRGVSFTVDRGELVVVMGPSGSGKTTLLSLLGGLDKPSAGEVYVDGHALHKMNARQLDSFRRNYIGFVFQFLNLIPKLTALENIEIPMVARGLKTGRDRILYIASQLGISNKLNRLVEELSGGEQQRVAIAAAVASDPPIIIADEPTAELDGETIEKVMDFFQGLRSMGKTIIVATHDPRVSRKADKIVLLEDGLVKGVYRGAEIVSSNVTIKSYRDYIRGRLVEIEDELRLLSERFKKGELSVDDFVKKYSRLKDIKKFLEDELKFG